MVVEHGGQVEEGRDGEVGEKGGGTAGEGGQSEVEGGEIGGEAHYCVLLLLRLFDWVVCAIDSWCFWFFF